MPMYDARWNQRILDEAVDSLVDDNPGRRA
jgi:hypothetical protein